MKQRDSFVPAEAPAAEEQSGEVVELSNSQPEPGGPPVRFDPAMVSQETAEQMRPLHRSRDT
jgi:hypothetical protein